MKIPDSYMGQYRYLLERYGYRNFGRCTYVTLPKKILRGVEWKGEGGAIGILL
jgi:hypothetical protein